MAPTQTDTLPDIQAESPQHPLRITGAGISGFKLPITIEDYGSTIATLTCGTALSEQVRGTHMSRLVAAAIDASEVPWLSLPEYLLATANNIADSLAMEDIQIRGTCTTVAFDTAGKSGATTTRTIEHVSEVQLSEAGDIPQILSAVSIQGITACPCAQAVVSQATRERLESVLDTKQQIDDVLGVIPQATHNQRSDAIFGIIGQRTIPSQKLVAIAELGLSATTHSVLKRIDEGALVEHAHDNAMFVEDSVRAMYAAAADSSDVVASEHFICHQRNHESIHSHDAWATIYGEKDHPYFVTDRQLPLDCSWILTV